MWRSVVQCGVSVPWSLSVGVMSWLCMGLLSGPELLGEVALVGRALPSMDRQLQHCWWHELEPETGSLPA